MNKCSKIAGTGFLTLRRGTPPQRDQDRVDGHIHATPHSLLGPRGLVKMVQVDIACCGFRTDWHPDLGKTCTLRVMVPHSISNVGKSLAPYTLFFSFAAEDKKPSRSKEIAYHTDVRPIELGDIDDLDWVRPGGRLRHVEVDRCRASSKDRKGFLSRSAPEMGSNTSLYRQLDCRCREVGLDCGCQILWCRISENNEGSAARETTLEVKTVSLSSCDGEYCLR